MHGGRQTAGFALAIAIAASGTAGATDANPIPGLTRTQLEEFRTGRMAFAEEETFEDGLGPVFNGTSCGGCHRDGGIGGGSDVVETRFGTRTNGAFDHMTYAGGSLIQTDGIGVQGACNYVGEQVPAEATIVAGRRTTALFGLGLVDAVPDKTFHALARLQSFWRPATAGRPNMVVDLDGRDGGRQVPLEEPGAEPLPVLRRRLSERDGHHDAALPGRELPAG